MEAAMPIISEKVFRDLYKETQVVRELKPWKHLYDNDIFVLRFPADDEVYYCSIIGANDETYGVCCYRGGEGFHQLRKLIIGELDQSKAVYIFDCLNVYYNNKSELQSEEIQIFEKYSIEPKGKNGYPNYMTFTPGLYPWPIEEKEALTLIKILKAVHEAVLPQYFKDESIHGAFERNVLPAFTETPDGKGKMNLEFSIEHFPDEIVQSPTDTPFRVDELKLANLKKAQLKRVEQIWEVGSFFSPEPVMEKERPYFPNMIIAVDVDSEFIFNIDIALYDSSFPLRVFNTLVASFEKHEIIPESLHFNDALTMAGAATLCQSLKIEIEMKENLPHLETAKEELFAMFTQDSQH
ncbi:MAG: hypothetical protein ABUK01_15955 [Leptospirales bacterium]